MPFEIPETWEWCRLSEIANYGGGKTPSMDNKQYWSNGTNLWITSKDMKCERITDSMMKISNEALDIMTQYEPGTLLMVTRSGILRHSLPIAILEEKATVNQDLKTISLHLQEIHEYVYYAIKARERYILKEYHKDGTTVDSINFEKFAEITLPIPPYDEQKRIVTAIKQWLSFIDELEQGAKGLVTSIQQTKTKILDLAIHGKLVPQDPNDEPAIELLKRINPSFVPCDNAHYPFDVPNNWTTCQLGDIYNIVSAKRVHKSEWQHCGIPFYRAREIVKLSENGEVDNDLFITKEHYSDLKKKYGVPRPSDIMISAVGTIGKTYIVKADDVFYYKDASVICLQNINDLYSPYISILLSSHFLQEQIFAQSKGTTVDTITIEKANSYMIPFPPIKEQQLIVAKIEELFAVLDEIQKSIEA